MAQEKIKGKILFESQIKCLSPLHIGCGSSDRSDLDILIDKNGKPFIPATSFVGALRHFIEQMTPINKDFKKKFENFWGFTTKTDGHQSSFHCSDLLCVNAIPSVIIRDGIKIDNSTGIVEDKGKYDYELVERGTIFNLNMEFFFNDSNEKFVKKMVATIYSLLNSNKIQLGAKTSSGLGEIQLIQEHTKIYEFDFTKKDDVCYWLRQQFSDENIISKNELGSALEFLNSHFTIDATMQLKNSLIIKSYSDDPKLPDSTHIKSLDDWVLTGTSLKGAIRARAERILNTLAKPKTIFDELFGYVDPGKPATNSKKGKIRINEIILPRFIAEVQTRIKIDRFTGGTIEAALFDSMPLFTDFKDKVINLEINVQNCTHAEAGLLLLVLKDLWSGDLAVGGEKNVGRGIFEGIKAIVKYSSHEPIIIDEDITKLDNIKKNELQNYVNALISEN